MEGPSWSSAALSGLQIVQPSAGQPIGGAQTLAQQTQAASMQQQHALLQQQQAAVQQAAMHLDAAGMENRPAWDRLAEGARPRQPTTEDLEPGDWQHGWQYFAANPLEHNEHHHLLSELRNRGTAGPLQEHLHITNL